MARKVLNMAAVDTLAKRLGEYAQGEADLAPSAQDDTVGAARMLDSLIVNAYVARVIAERGHGHDIEAIRRKARKFLGYT